MVKKLIALVDDEPDILDFLSYNLKKEGYDVLTYDSGNAFLADADNVNPDLLILDIMMPGIDGVELCKLLRQKEDYEDTSITFLTARGEDSMHITALENGGDDFIQKPVSPKVFVARVKTLLKRSGENVEKSILSFDNLVIDKSSMVVHIDDKKIDLVKKEFQLLVLLASRPGKVFTRDEILSKVWGLDVIVGDRTIDVHVRKLREKIGSNYIRTVKGVGYKFEF